MLTVFRAVLMNTIAGYDEIFCFFLFGKKEKVIRNVWYKLEFTKSHKLTELLIRDSPNSPQS